ncbi:hypothetical protein QYF61_025833 [Mycteria americana]|uniref:Uncharacterized protein n=1 Tax=Mycteria americana TaxID=33587 RepID=A0AAN7NC66_MYCAM|nr:hypothetical protein QYF61_025833 [Mycteria americana]
MRTGGGRGRIPSFFPRKNSAGGFLLFLGGRGRTHKGDVSCKICKRISAVVQVSTLSPGCSDAGITEPVPLEGGEAKQLGSLSREGGTDKAIGKGAQALSLWSVKERYPFEEDVICHPGKWTTMERGIHYLRELAMLEVIYDDLDNDEFPKDPDEVKCT